MTHNASQKIRVGNVGTNPDRGKDPGTALAQSSLTLIARISWPHFSRSVRT